MFKKVCLILLSLLGTGVGLSLYLPAYTPEGNPRLSYQLIESTLTDPVDSSDYQNSNNLFSDENLAEVKYGLQLGIFSNLADITDLATQVAQYKTVTTDQLIVFKAKSSYRQWYVLSIGPIITHSELQDFQLLLTENHIPSQVISWPPFTETQEP